MPCTFLAKLSFSASIAYIQTTRALMITGSILGFPAVVMLLMSMPCINLGSEPQSSKNKRAILGGVLILIVGKRLVNIHVNISLNLPDSDHFYTCTRCLQAVASTGC